MAVRRYSDNRTLTVCGSIGQDLQRYLRFTLSSNRKVQSTVGNGPSDQYSECFLSQDSDLSDDPERQLFTLTEVSNLTDSAIFDRISGMEEKLNNEIG